jgi:hypothetical protein
MANAPEPGEESIPGFKNRRVLIDSGSIPLEKSGTAIR